MKSVDNIHFYLVYYGSCDEARHNRPKTCCCRSAQQNIIIWKPARTARMESVSDKTQNINWGSVYHSSCNDIWHNKEAQSKAGNLPIWGMWQRMGVQDSSNSFSCGCTIMGDHLPQTIHRMFSMTLSWTHLPVVDVPVDIHLLYAKSLNLGCRWSSGSFYIKAQAHIDALSVLELILIPFTAFFILGG